MKCPAVPGSCMPPPHGHARAGTGAAGASRARYDPRGEREEGVHAGAAGPSLSEMRASAATQWHAGRPGPRNEAVPATGLTAGSNAALRVTGCL